jgi:hypothetical protein
VKPPRGRKISGVSGEASLVKTRGGCADDDNLFSPLFSSLYSDIDEHNTWLDAWRMSGELFKLLFYIVSR